ncbi:EAL domain-containing protein [Lysobacter korlensis]|uniref:EAL domain-containing protein n=1 Tax=Lysobacter korlensis TaxID=553636 RepID=A0ABV6RLG9_9GAMM
MDQYLGGALPALGAALSNPQPGSPLFLSRLVAAAREHLDADIGFLCEFDGSAKVVRKVDGTVHGQEVGVGTSFPLDETYCRRLTSGELPSVVHDGRNDPRVRDLPITRELDIGTYIGVPVNLPDGSLYGTLCCISHEVDRSIHERDVKFMRVLGALIGNELAEQRAADQEHRSKLDRIGRLTGSLRVVYQPVVELDGGALVGMEALARFDTDPPRSPDQWFADAWSVGLGAQLELAAVRAALSQRGRLSSDLYMAINASPIVLQSQALLDELYAVRGGPVLLEVTEHAAVNEYGPLMQALASCRACGVRIAVDDFGAGYSGLSHVLRISPNVLKLDMQLTRDIDRDGAKQALASATVGFAAKAGVDIIAEGVENAAEAGMLREIGVRYGQGFHFGRPGPLPH